MRMKAMADADAAGSDAADDRAASISLNALYRDNRARLQRFFIGRGRRADAEDLVQETFLRMAAVEARGGPTITQPTAYATRVAGNLVLEQARFAARRSAALHVSDRDVPLATSDPVAQLEARDVLARLEQAMTRMKPATREIFMAHRLEGFTYREIAEHRGQSVKAVEKHIAKAMIVVNRAMRGR